MKRHCLPSVLLAWIVSAGNVYADNGYIFRDLGNFGKQYARVVSINDQGVMLIYADEPRSLRSFLVDGSRVTPLPEGFGGAAINNRGEVAGFSLTPVQAEEYNALPGAAVYSNGRVTRLAPVFSEALAMNDKGDIVGWTWPSAAVIWENGVLRVLDEATGGGHAYLTGINDKGLVVGYKAYTSNVYVNGWPMSVWRAVYWDQIGLHHLSPPSAAGLVGEEHQYAVAVNKKGEILVTTYPDNPQCVPPRAFILRMARTSRFRCPRAAGSCTRSTTRARSQERCPARTFLDAAGCKSPGGHSSGMRSHIPCCRRRPRFVPARPLRLTSTAWLAAGCSSRTGKPMPPSGKNGKPLH